MEMTGPTSSRAPRVAASTGDFPSAMWRSIFSTTTIASSTTIPTAKTIARSVSRLIENPNAYMSAIAPTNESGMATIGINTERNEPMNRKITIITMISVSISVVRISFNASSMYLLASYAILTFRPAGRARSISGTTARTLLITSTVLSVGKTQMPMNVAAWPPNRTSVL
jgi:hypothetical protein